MEILHDGAGLPGSPLRGRLRRFNFVPDVVSNLRRSNHDFHASQTYKRDSADELGFERQDYSPHPWGSPLRGRLRRFNFVPDVVSNLRRSNQGLHTSQT